jgi:hypothetical protein
MNWRNQCFHCKEIFRGGNRLVILEIKDVCAFDGQQFALHAECFVPDKVYGWEDGEGVLHLLRVETRV